MGCVICGRSLRTSYLGNGKRGVRGVYCFLCGKADVNKVIL